LSACARAGTSERGSPFCLSQRSYARAARRMSQVQCSALHWRAMAVLRSSWFCRRMPSYAACSTAADESTKSPTAGSYLPSPPQWYQTQPPTLAKSTPVYSTRLPRAKWAPPGTAGARNTGRNADVNSVAGCTPREARYAWCAGRMQSRPSHLVRRVRCADGCGCARTRGRPARVSAPTPPRASSSRRPASTRPFSRRVEYSQHGTASHSCFQPPGLGHQSAASTRNLLP
jgi:hypothetical protein